MTMNGALPARVDMDRLYVTREEEGRGWMNVSGGCGESGETQFVGLLEKRSGQFRQGVERFIKKGKQELTSDQKKMKLDGWRDKPLHGQYPLKTVEKSSSCQRWLQAGYLKKGTRS